MQLRKKHAVRLIISAIIVIGFSQLTTSCLSFRISEKKAYKYFEGAPLQPKIHKMEVDGHHMNYADIGSDTLPTVIFFHGAPGGWNAFIDFMANPELQQFVRWIYVDRPGYGYSEYGKPVTSLERQAQLVKPILESVKESKTILVGHSLGGSVIARIAMDYPDLVDGLILVGGSIDPEMEKDEWYRYVMRTALGRLLLPGSFWSTNEEIFFLKEELEEMIPGWEKIQVPVTVIQGVEDALVPKENANFAERMLDPRYVDVWLEEGVNHFIPWNRPDLIEKAIFKHVKAFNDSQNISAY